LVPGATFSRICFADRVTVGSFQRGVSLLRRDRNCGGAVRCAALLFGLLLSFCWLAPTEAWGRAGGGGSYSGGGGGGGGGGYSGGGGGGGGDLLILLIELCIRYPKVGVPLLVLCCVGFVIYQVNFGGRARSRSPAYGRASPRRRERRVGHTEWVKKIQASDAAFDVADFRRDFEHAFVEIQQAWQNQDMKTVQHFVTDGIYEKFVVQFRAQQLQGYREKLEKIAVHDVRIAEWRPAGVFEVLTVQVGAAMVDYRVSPESGEWISGSRSVEHFEEYWSFIRRRNLQSADRQGSLLGGACPNCGTSIELNQFCRCSSCDAVLRSGTHDWVLSEITQASEWRAHQARDLRHAENYRNRHDSDFSLQHLEDRASVIFYRKAAAALTGSIDPLRKMATEEFCDAYQPGLSAASRKFDVDCAVGSVDCQGLIADAEQHYAVLEIRWSARPAEMGKGGKVSAFGHTALYYSWMVLMRLATARGKRETGFASTQCPSCGAPESDLKSDACDYCGEVMNTGLHDWVLVEFHRSRESSEATQWKRRLNDASRSVALASAAGTGAMQGAVSGDAAPEVSPVESLAWAVRVLAEDGVLDEAEREAIRQLASKNRISEEMVQQWVNQALQSELPPVQMPDKKAQQGWLGEVVEIALADNQVDDVERQMLKQLASSLGMSWYDVNLVIRKKQLHPPDATETTPV